MVTRRTKTTSKGYKPPKWFKRIKPGSHGSTPSQKRYWAVISELVRKEDWTKEPRCKTCGCVLASWQDGQCGHYKSFATCHSWFKYERKNLALQCPTCNANFRKDNSIGFAFGTYLISKYGTNILDWIDTENEKYRGVKIKEWEIVDKVAEMRPDLVE